MNPSTPQSLASVKPFSKRSSNLIRRLQVSSITFAFFSFSVIVCCRHPFCLHPRPVANFLCSVFSSFSFFGSISQSHESNGGGEGRRGRCRSSTFANFNSRNLCPAECFGGGGNVCRDGDLCEEGDVCACVWPVCGTALIL